MISTLKLFQESQITVLCHPATYINKIIIGYENGQLELWNIRKKSLIHTFSSHISYFNQFDSTSKSNNSKNNNIVIPSITCIEQSPACDVCAIGFSSGY